MKSETSFRVFFLKQHRKNSLKNIFFPSESVFLDFSFWPQGHRTWQNAHCAVWSSSSLTMSTSLCITAECNSVRCSSSVSTSPAPALAIASITATELNSTARCRAVAFFSSMEGWSTYWHLWRRIDGEIWSHLCSSSSPRPVANNLCTNKQLLKSFSPSLKSGTGDDSWGPDISLLFF